MTDRDSTTRTRARTPGEEDYPPSTAVYWRVTDPTLSGIFVDTNAMHEGRKQTNTGPAHAGSRLKLSDALGRRRPKCHPSSRTGENPPYGMIGGIEETSASFEARSAPRSYPTACAHRIHAGKEGIAARGTALHGDIVHEYGAFVSDAVDVRRLADHQAAMIDARLHPADVIAHDEKDVGFLWLLRGCRSACHRNSGKHCQPDCFDEHFGIHRVAPIGVWVHSMTPRSTLFAWPQLICALRCYDATSS